MDSKNTVHSPMPGAVLWPQASVPDVPLVSSGVEEQMGEGFITWLCSEGEGSQLSSGGEGSHSFVVRGRGSSHGFVVGERGHTAQ